MANENQLPEDMWEDTDPVPTNTPDTPTPSPAPQPVQPTPAPIPTPESAAVNPEPTFKPAPSETVQPVLAPTPAQAEQLPTTPATPPQPRNLGWLWGLLIAVLLIGGGVYAWQTYFASPQTNEPPQEQPQVPAEGGEVQWTDRVRTANLRLLDPQDERNRETTYWKVGRFTEGKYEGADLVVMTTPPYGPMFGNMYYRFAVKDAEVVMIESASMGLYDDDGLDRTAFSVDSDYSIPELTFPLELANPNDAAQKLIQEEFRSNAWFEDKKNLKPVFEADGWGTVYMETTTQSIPIAPPTAEGAIPEGGFYLMAPDSTLRVYKLEVLFIQNGSTPNITWDQGGKNTAEYMMTDQTGCGSFNYASVMPAVLESELQEAGVATYGGKEQPVWILSDPQHRLLLDTYELSKINDEAMQRPITPYGEFIAGHPLFFWKDSFDRIIKFQNIRFVPLAECGKPVIYLYPEQPTEVSVKVEPRGGMSYSDPEYNDGWKVLAQPNGELKLLSTGATYPYLFWEGDGGIYQSPDRGWVVKQQDVAGTIQEKLSLYGFNQKEIVDFQEYWLPRMQDAPYYFISFLGTAAMDQLAPLTITPKPDTVIRVLMDFKPLDKPMTVQPYPIRTIPRHGFTVMEWGGVTR